MYEFMKTNGVYFKKTLHLLGNIKQLNVAKFDDVIRDELDAYYLLGMQECNTKIRKCTQLLPHLHQNLAAIVGQQKKESIAIEEFNIRKRITDVQKICDRNMQNRQIFQEQMWSNNYQFICVQMFKKVQQFLNDIDDTDVQEQFQVIVYDEAKVSRSILTVFKSYTNDDLDKLCNIDSNTVHSYWINGQVLYQNLGKTMALVKISPTSNQFKGYTVLEIKYIKYDPDILTIYPDYTNNYLLTSISYYKRDVYEEPFKEIIDCPECGNYFVLDKKASDLICEQCGHIEVFFSSDFASTYNTHQVINEANYYDRLDYWKTTLREFRGNEKKVIPEEIKDDVLIWLFSRGYTDPSKILDEHLRKALKNTKHPEWYKHVHSIMCETYGIPPPDITPAECSLLNETFIMVNKVWENEMTPEEKMGRQNILNLHYIMFQLARLLGMTRFISRFRLLTRIKVLKTYDIIWNRMMNKLGWQFLPTVKNNEKVICY